MHDLRSQEPEPTSSASDDRPARNTRVRSSSGLVTLGAIAAMLAMIGGIVFGVRDHERILDLLTGKAWLANDERGSITLVNGATGQAEFEMRFRGAAGDEFVATVL